MTVRQSIYRSIHHNRVLSVALAVGLVAGCVEYEIPKNLPHYPDSDPKAVPPSTQEDAFVQTSTPIVDVLFTIDNSCSMRDEQEALSWNFPSFIGYFEGSGLDYHVGVISTDLDSSQHQGRLREARGVRYIDANTPDATEVFTEMASMSTEGSGTERGLGAIYFALEEQQEYNAGFRRDEAEMHTIVITDEEDQTQETVITKQEFISWYDGLTRDAEDRTFSSIVKLEGMQRGDAYLDVTRRVGGISWNIDTDDWADLLDRLGVQASGIKREFYLSQRPVEGTIEVEVEDPTGVVLPFTEAADDPPMDGWTYSRSRNSITFVSFIPPEESRIVIRYTLLSTEDQVSEQITND